MNTPKKILVIRNDKIGDFMLAWPAFALLREQYPNTEITALVPQYTAPLAEQCEWIDRVLIDTKKDNFFDDIILLSKNIKLNNYDVSISFFSELRTSIALWLANVKIRIGPATKIAQFFLNRTLKQNRSQSKKPEYEYNIDLVRYFLNHNDGHPKAPLVPPFFKLDKNEINQLKNSIKKHHHIPEDHKIIIIHPGTGGSAINLTIEQYAKLAQKISEQGKLYFIITAGPGELPSAISLSNSMIDLKHHIYESKNGIINFCKIINTCDLFISGSTGPLHIAGALNMPTAAFYPARQSATSLRWETVNNKEIRLAFSPNKYTGDNDMLTIDIETCAKKIDSLLTQYEK